MDRSKIYKGAFLTADAPWDARQLRQQFPDLAEIVDEADRQALAELAALAAERVDLQSRLKALHASIDAMNSAE